MVSMSLNEAVSLFVTAKSEPGDEVVISITYNGESKPLVYLDTAKFSRDTGKTVESRLDLTPYLHDKYRWKTEIPSGGEVLDGYHSWSEYVKQFLLPAVASVTNAGLRKLKKVTKI